MGGRRVKSIQKPPEPKTLVTYRTACPNGTWDKMRDDAHHDGMQAYRDVKTTLVRTQRALCAYCERHIAPGMSDNELDQSKSRQRVEHFHPKSDTSGAVNWALLWGNMWAVCLGGGEKPPEGIAPNSADYLPPLPQNLSCDSYKDRQIATGALSASPEGWILSPGEVPSFPRLVRYTSDGTVEPDPTICANHQVQGNRHADTQTLVTETIRHLNLCCHRLMAVRHVALRTLENLIAKRREANPQADPHTVLREIATRLFSPNVERPWPELFTMIRWRLGQAAEEVLYENQYQG